MKKTGTDYTKGISSTALGNGMPVKTGDAHYATGHDDAGISPSKKTKKRSKSSGSGTGDAGHETDAGYISGGQQPSSPKIKSKSSRIFKLGNKSKTNVEQERPASPPPAPAPPVFRTPIAARFATTLGNLDSPSAIEPQLSPPPPPTPFSVPNEIFSPHPTTSKKPELSVETPSSPKSSRGLHLVSDSGDHGGRSTPSIFSFSRTTSSSSSSFIASFSMSHSNTTSKPPVISLPLTRSPSPPPQSTPLHSHDFASLDKVGTKHVPNPLAFSKEHGSQSRLGTPMGSPMVSTPVSSLENASPVSPKKKGFLNRAGDLVRNKTRQEKDNGSPQPSTPVSPILSLNRSESPPGQVLVIPSAERVPRPARLDPLDPPINTYSYYELPPPSPPPDSPLPKLPESNGYEPAATLSPGNTLQPPRMLTPNSSRPNSPFGRPVSPMSLSQRGRESPFPTSPIVPNGLALSLSRLPSSTPEPRPVVLGPMHREPVYTPPPPGTRHYPAAPQTHHASSFTPPSGYQSDDILSAPARYTNFHRNHHSEDSQPTPPTRAYGGYGGIEDWGKGLAYDDDEDDDADSHIRAVASQYHTGSMSTQGQEPALGRSTSFEALRDRSGQSSVPAANTYFESQYDSDDQSHYPDDEAMGDRSTMYTIASNYSAGDLSIAESRTSFMDPTKSEKSRDRFVRRIEAMFDANGRELPPRDVIPPVPKLPQGITTNGARRGGWF